MMPLVVKSETWHFRCGEVNILIRNPQGKIFLRTIEELGGYEVPDPYNISTKKLWFVSEKLIYDYIFKFFYAS
jgi:hypothetical protein